MRKLFGCIALLTAVAHAQWTLQDSGTTASLRGIYAVSAQIAWASGSGGTVLRTVDGGKHWQHCAVPDGDKDGAKLDFRGVQAFDAQTAIVMSSGKGDLSRLYKTVDGCATWKLLFANPDEDGFWDGLQLYTIDTGSIRGWLLGDPTKNQFTLYQVYGSLEAGRKWQFVREQAFSLSANPAVAGAFAASNSALAVRNRCSTTTHPNYPLEPSVIVTTTDCLSQEMFVSGGVAGSRVYERSLQYMGDTEMPVHWSSEAVPLGSMTDASGAFSIAFSKDTSPRHAVAVGGDYTKPEAKEHTVVYFNGLEWLPSERSVGGYRSAVEFVPGHSDVCIAVGPNGTDLGTHSGRWWRPLRPGLDDAPDADKNWNALSLPFVVGAKGRIGVLRDGALAVK